MHPNFKTCSPSIINKIYIPSPPLGEGGRGRRGRDREGEEGRGREEVEGEKEEKVAGTSERKSED